MAALLGPGRYVWRDEAFVEVGEALVDAGKVGAFQRASKGDGSLRINTTMPAFVALFLDGTNFEKRKWTRAEEKVLRFRCGSPVFHGWHFNGDASENNLPASGVRSLRVVCYQVVDPNWEDGKRYVPAPGTPATVQIVPVDTETVEFFVEAPKVEKREKKSGSGGDGEPLAPPPGVPPAGELPPGAPPAIPTPVPPVD
jgi:hypothetical protein